MLTLHVDKATLADAEIRTQLGRYALTGEGLSVGPDGGDGHNVDVVLELGARMASDGSRGRVMGEAIGELLPFAVGVAISPMPIVAMILMLMASRTTGVAFAVGWLAGIGLAGAVLLLVAGGADTGTNQDSPTWVSILQLVLGLLLVALALKQWHGRPKGDAEPPAPTWMGAVASFSPVKAIGLAVALGVVNPKNLVFLIGGATAVSQSGADAGGQALAWVVFTIIAGMGVVAPFVVYLALGDRASHVLDEVKGWMIHNNAAIMAVLFLVIGAKMLGQGISGLAG